MKTSFIILPLALLVSACGSSGGGGDDTSLDLAKIDRFNDLDDKIFDLPEPIGGQLPTGAVVYTGLSNVSVSVASDIIDLYSDTEVTVDYASNTLSGNLTNFERSDNFVVPYEGSITLTNGTTSLDDFRFQADYSGTLTGEGNVIVLVGDLSGGPKGESGEALELSGFALPGEGVTLNGAPAGVFVDVVAEQ